MVSLSIEKALVALAAVAVAAAIGGAFALGIGPLGGGTDGGGVADGGGSTPVPTGTVYTVTESGGGTAESQPPFAFEIDDIEECGRTCRDVTATLSNDQEQTASNVTVYTRIYAGNSTDQSDRIWNGQEDIGTLDADSSDTRTQRVELSTSEAFAVQQNDGWITILTTVKSDDTTITFKDRRKVA